jgi:hypothetical protein
LDYRHRQPATFRECGGWTGTFLDAEDTTIQLEDNGDIAAVISTSTNGVSSGFTFTRQPPLSGAKLYGKDIPATNCTTTYVSGEPDKTDCTDTTVSLSVNWVGVGETSRERLVDHMPFLPEGVLNLHQVMFTREATTTGTFNVPLGTADDADLGTERFGEICAKCSG